MVLEGVIANHDSIDQHAGHHNIFRADGTVFDDAFHLGDHFSAPSLRRHDRRKHFEDHGFMGCAQVDGRYAPMDVNFHATEDFVNDLRTDFTMYVRDHVNMVRTDLADRIENSKRMRSQQTIQYYESRIERYKKNIEMQEFILESSIMSGNTGTTENTLPMMRKNLKDLEQEKQEAIDKINENPNLKVTSEPMSLNLVNVV